MPAAQFGRSGERWCNWSLRPAMVSWSSAVAASVVVIAIGKALAPSYNSNEIQRQLEQQLRDDVVLAGWSIVAILITIGIVRVLCWSTVQVTDKGLAWVNRFAGVRIGERQCFEWPVPIYIVPNVQMRTVAANPVSAYLLFVGSPRGGLCVAGFKRAADAQEWCAEMDAEKFFVRESVITRSFAFVAFP